MKDQGKTKKQLIRELGALQNQLVKLKKAEAGRKEAEEALKESEQRFRTIFNGAVDGILLADVETKKLHSGNKTICSMLGYDLRGIEGLSIKEIHPREVLPVVMEQFDKLARGEITKSCDLPVKRKDGSVFYASISTVLLELDAGTYLMGTFRDITERKRAEGELRLFQQDWENVFQAIGHPTLILDKEHNIIQANRAVLKVTGEPEERILGKKCPEVFHNKDQPPECCPLERMLASGHLKTVEMEMEALGGVYLVSCTPVFDDAGHLQRIIHMATDITQRKRAEEALLREKCFSDAVIDSLPGVFYVIDEKGNYIRWNKNEMEVTEYSAEEMLRINALATIAEEDRAAIADKIRDVFAIGHATGEARVLTKTGKKIPYYLTGARAVIGENTYLLGMGIDITERKRAEEERKALREQLLQSQKMEAIGRLAGGVAHDFNNLLTIIKGYCELSLTELKEDGPLKGNVEKIHQATDRAADLVRQLLAFGRRQILEMKVLNLNTILANLDKMLRRALREDIELTMVLSGGLGRVRIDSGWIEQAVLNLALNARDAMPNGGKLTVETANVELDDSYARNHISVKPGPYVMLSVSDTGVGMSQEVRERLFEPFFSTKDKDPGRGLGLSTIYGTVKQSGGHIWVYSELGQGTTFKIYLPRVDEASAETKEKAAQEELPRGHETVLVVEDEEEVRRLSVRILQRQGYQVLQASQGDDALWICGQHGEPIHLILTDVVMPVMSGRQLVDRCREIRQDFKVLYMSGYADDAIIQQGV
ncbi:MAG TPA: PAS domain S-box protein, partial [Thermodesulfobacteriota bacterium]|nr:PAS domain S-box protein [Thermodesulfobacteriota bacterium]